MGAAVAGRTETRLRGNSIVKKQLWRLLEAGDVNEDGCRGVIVSALSRLLRPRKTQSKQTDTPNPWLAFMLGQCPTHACIPESPEKPRPAAEGQASSLGPAQGPLVPHPKPTLRLGMNFDELLEALAQFKLAPWHPRLCTSLASPAPAQDGWGLKFTSGSSCHREQNPQADVIGFIFIKRTRVQLSLHSRHCSRHYYEEETEAQRG